jgi:ABC-type lipoprotein export system ATPase subunit
MRDLAHQRGRAVVVVTHDSRVLEFGDRIVRMEDGRITSSANEAPKIPPQWAIASEAQPPSQAC